MLIIIYFLSILISRQLCLLLENEQRVKALCFIPIINLYYVLIIHSKLLIKKYEQQHSQCTRNGINYV